MEVILRPRGGGKTTELIKKAAETNSYIVCQDQMHAERTFARAQELGLKIHFPITFEEFRQRRYYGRGIKGFVIDNIDLFLQGFSPVQIMAVSASIPGIDTIDPQERDREEKKYFR